MRKQFLTVIVICCIAASVKAQTIDPSILASAGGFNKTSTIALDWTMGEYAVETISFGNRMYTQGYNQPYLIVIPPYAFTANKSTYKISIAPNPVLSILNFSISSANDREVYVSVADIHGIVFIQRKVRSSLGSLQLNFKGLPAGTYNLTVREAASSRIIKAYQVIRL